VLASLGRLFGHMERSPCACADSAELRANIAGGWVCGWVGCVDGWVHKHFWWVEGGLSEKVGG
jgi:hypothetical protein